MGSEPRWARMPARFPLACSAFIHLHSLSCDVFLFALLNKELQISHGFPPSLRPRWSAWRGGAPTLAVVPAETTGVSRGFPGECWGDACALCTYSNELRDIQASSEGCSLDFWDFSQWRWFGCLTRVPPGASLVWCLSNWSWGRK